MAKPEDILAEGAPHASDWVKDAEKIRERRKKEDQPSLYEYLNHDQKVTNQKPSAEYIVLYNKSGTNIAAAYITMSERKHAGQLPIEGFVVDHVAYRYYADSEEHALYLVGILNSSVVNDAIKPYQSQGLKGERDIHRRPFEVCPIPLFDKHDQLHRQIADAASKARKKMMQWKSRIAGNAAQARQAARKIVQPELHVIDRLVRDLLDSHNPGSDLALDEPRAGGLFGARGKVLGPFLDPRRHTFRRKKSQATCTSTVPPTSCPGVPHALPYSTKPGRRGA